MSNFSIILGSTDVPQTPVKPDGLTGLKLSIEQDADKAFFRQKVTGTLSFNDSLFPFIKPLEPICCKFLLIVPFGIEIVNHNPKYAYLEPTSNRTFWN